MPKLFGIDIAKTVNDSIASAGGVLDATLIVVTPGVRSAADPTAGTNPTTRPVRCKGFIGRYKEGQIDGTRIQVGDRRVILLGASISGGNVVPKPSDKITIEGETLTIVAGGVSRDPAAATYVCQCRK